MFKCWRTLSSSITPCSFTLGLATAIRRCGHITPVLQQLHCGSEWNFFGCPRIQGTWQLGITVSITRLSAHSHIQLLSAPIIKQFQVHSYQHQLSSCWSCIRCCRATTLQWTAHTRPSAEFEHWTVSNFLYWKMKTCLIIWGTSAQWLLFIGAVYKFPYLLTCNPPVSQILSTVDSLIPPGLLS